MPVTPMTKSEIVRTIIFDDEAKTKRQARKSVMLSTFKKYGLCKSAKILTDEGVHESKSGHPVEEYLEGRLQNCGSWSWMARTMLRWHHPESFVEIVEHLLDQNSRYMVQASDLTYIWAYRESGHETEADTEIGLVMKYAAEKGLKRAGVVEAEYWCGCCLYQYGWTGGIITGLAAASELVRAGSPASISFPNVDVSSLAGQLNLFPVIVDVIRAKNPLVTVSGKGAVTVDDVMTSLELQSSVNAMEDMV